MPRLAVLGPDRVPLIVTLDRDAITVGRSPACELVLTEPTVSRQHGRLFACEGTWRYEDLGSRHGSLVNGRRVTGAGRVEPGDRLGLGLVELVFEPPRDEGRLWWTKDPTARESSADLPIGDSDGMAEACRLVDIFAISLITVLIRGETGTGKDLLARRLHERSPRRGGPFVVVNCPALPESLIEAELFGTERGVATGVDARPGLTEAADGGTLFLDEVGDLSLPAQAKLLRFLQDRTILRLGGRAPRALDVRVVAATHRDLAGLVAADRFRRDLYHRLDAATVEVPPLRERLEDVPALVDHFLSAQPPPRPRFSEEALDALLRHDWPGNVRELEQAVQRGALLAPDGVVRPEHLPRALSESLAARVTAASPVEELYRQLAEGRACFWALVREPYLARTLSREDARSLVARLLADAEGSNLKFWPGFALSD